MGLKGEVRHFAEELDEALPRRGPCVELMSDDALSCQIYNSLPEVMTIYRGVPSASHPEGFSWSTSWDVANIYAHRRTGWGDPSGDPAVLCMKLPKKFALAIKPGVRSPHGDADAAPEIIARVCRSRIFRVERTSPESAAKSIGALFEMAVSQLGLPALTPEQIAQVRPQMVA